jgi:hypothetical protein
MASWAARCVPHTLRVLVVLAGIAAVGYSSAAAAKVGARSPHTTREVSEKLADSFQAFCNEWMDKLQARESYNLTHIKWETTPAGVVGTYVGYSPEHTCTLDTARPPVGEIDYRQVSYEKRGATIADAERSVPEPVEIYATREFFSYIKGKWDY